MRMLPPNRINRLDVFASLLIAACAWDFQFIGMLASRLRLVTRPRSGTELQVLT